jgi:hypothetical protein
VNVEQPISYSGILGRRLVVVVVIVVGCALLSMTTTTTVTHRSTDNDNDLTSTPSSGIWSMLVQNSGVCQFLDRRYLISRHIICYRTKRSKYLAFLTGVESMFRRKAMVAIFTTE